MNHSIRHCLFIGAWLLAAASQPQAAGGDNLDCLCSSYRLPGAVTHPAPDDIPDLRHGRGLLWRVATPDGRTSHLFGTLHSQDRRVSSLPPQVRLALAHSRQLLMEVVPDAESNRVFLDAMFAGDEASLAGRLPDPLFREFSRIVTDYHVPAERADQLTPWAAFSLIGRPRPVNAPTQDMNLYREAEQRGVPVTGLETMHELTETLSSIPHADQIEILTDTICNHGRIVAGNKVLLELYLQRDLAGMLAFNRGERRDDAVSERFKEKILHERNERIVERMRPHIEQGDAFVAVGALHLPDERGLLEMLEREGYAVSPVY